MTIIYGIPNCDTVKKARAWFDTHGLAYTFYDFKKQGVPAQQLDGWVRALGWETLVNKKGTTWRKLTADEQAAVLDADSAKALMLRQPSVVKRPVVERGAGANHGLTVGLAEAIWNTWR
jgi:arsenate reductase (glutaredoxin)